MNEDLVKKVLSCPRLPTLPAIAFQVIELCRDDNVQIKRLAQTLCNDPALTTKVLRTANSAFYGLSQHVTTVSHAVVILGLNSVRTLALGFTLFGTIRNSKVPKFDMESLWRRCLYSAVASRIIAQKSGAQYEEAFLGGLLQDIGVLALMQTLGSEYIQIVEQAGEEHRELRRLEKKNLHCDHAEIGAALAESWHLPPILVAPIRYHEAVDQTPRPVQSMVQSVALGTLAADLFVRPSPPDPSTYFEQARRWFGLNREQAMEIIRQIETSTQELAGLFNVDVSDIRTEDEVLEMANEQLQQLSLQSAQSATQLEERNQVLQEKVTTDPLTGVSNRGAFDEFLAHTFEDARVVGRSLTMVLLDADRFKSVNDTHGHQVGDVVLQALAEVLRRESPAGALVARYGGEEFAVILPETPRRQGATFAELLRSAIEQTRIKVDQRLTLNITASIGVASYEPNGPLQSPALLLKAADKGVYAAKQSGRNCVRVFTPRVAGGAVPAAQ